MTTKKVGAWMKRMERLTVADVSARVDKLAEIARSKDYESADAEEHRIWKDVLMQICEGHPRPKAIAKEALTTGLLDFPRGWGS